jgi:hypothetical protein
MRINEEVRLSFIPGRYKPYLFILAPAPKGGTNFFVLLRRVHTKKIIRTAFSGR